VPCRGKLDGILSFARMDYINQRNGNKWPG
jgi:hypothetical protein